VHAFLEGLGWVEDFEAQEEAMAAHRLLRRADPLQSKAAIDFVKGALAREDVYRALSQDSCEAPPGCELEVRSEERFSLELENEDGELEL